MKYAAILLLFLVGCQDNSIEYVPADTQSNNNDSTTGSGADTPIGNAQQSDEPADRQDTPSGSSSDSTALNKQSVAPSVSGPIVVCITSNSCTACVVQKSIYNAARLSVSYANANERKDWYDWLNGRGVPTTVILRGNEPIWTRTGIVTEKELREALGIPE